MRYEVEVVQVAVEEKLKNSGWAYEREVSISRNGASKIDFLACINEKHAVVIECKRNCDKIGAAIYQLLRYAYWVRPVATEHNRRWIDLWSISFREDKRCYSPLIIQARYASVVLPAIVVPRFSATDEDREICAEYGVALGYVDTPRHAQLNLPLD